MKYLLPLMMFSLAAPAMAQTSNDAPSKTEVEKEKKICRREMSTGSMMAKRTCHTKTEWTAIDQQNQANTEASRHGPQTQSGRNF